MAEKKKQGEINSKVGPITGTPSGLDAATSLYDQDGNVITNTNIREDNAITRANPTDPNDPEARIGDYVLQQGGVAAVVPNSRTDLIRRYGAVTGGSTRQKLKLTDYSNALVNGFSAFMGAPTDTSNIATTVATSTVGQLVKGTPLKWFWAALNAADSLMKAQDAYTKAWADQEVDYDVALDFSTDEDGREIAKVNYEKMKDAGVGSGADVLKATDTENSDVALLEDNNLSVNVSPAFASSDLYKNIISQVKDAYPNLTQEMANTVIDEETGATVLDTIKRVILSQESQYYYNARAIYDFKQIAPDASVKSLEEASYTQLIGAMNQDSLKEMTVTVYNDTNEAVEVNAEEYLNSIKDMDDKGRENYMVSLGNRIQSEDISDDEKAVLQAQANALYMASNSDGAYKDMYKKDFWDSVADTRTLFFGIRAGSIFGIDELTTFEDNELYRAGLDLTTGVTRALVTAKAMGAIEKLERAGISALGSKIGDNALGRALSSVNTYAPQGENFHLHDIGAGMSATNYLGRTTVQNLTQLAADATFDLAKMGAYAATGEDYDFWSELRTDFLIDTLMTYGPSAYVESTEAPKYERRRVAYMGDDSKGNTLDDIKRVEDDEFYSGEYEGPYGRGLYEVKMVELTADELAKRRAEKLDKLSDTKVGMKVQELFFDRNAAMGKLAAQIRGTVSGDNYYFRKMLRYSGDIRQLTKDVLNEYKSRESAQKALGDLEAVIREIAPKTRDWTKADDRYVNAMINQTRFLEQWKGDKNTEASIREKYEDAINGVSPERAAQLNRYIDAMRTVAADAMDFYVERGVLTKKGLADLRKNPTYKKGIYAPVWTKGRTSGDGEILQGRATIKSVFDPKVLIDVKDLESPIVTIGSFLNNVARNVAINERALAIREAASVAGVKIHLTEDTGGALSDVKNLRELNENFEKKYQNIVKEVREAIPTRKQWQEINDKLILDSVAMKSAGELERLKDEGKALKKELKARKKAQEEALGKIEEYERTAKRTEELNLEIEATGQRIKELNDSLMMINSFPEEWNEVLPNLSYDERKSLANDVVRYNNNDYIVLYRVQNGSPDDWHANNRGKDGKFEATGGEEALRGAVWLTADPKWAEGPERASAGVGKDATNDNILVIPVKRTDILDLGRETDAKNELEKSGKKIVKTRGIDGGLKKSEYILWKDEHPEILDDGMNLMYEEYMKNQVKLNERKTTKIKRSLSRENERFVELVEERASLPKNDYYRKFEKPDPDNSMVKLDESDEPLQKYGFGDFMFATMEYGNGGFYEDVLASALKSQRGQEAFSYKYDGENGPNYIRAYNDAVRKFSQIYDDSTVRGLLEHDNDAQAFERIKELAESSFTDQQKEAMTFALTRRMRDIALKRRNELVSLYDATRPLRERLGVESYTWGFEDKYFVGGGGAYGTYDSGNIIPVDATGRNYRIVSPQEIRIAITYFEDNIPAMKSTIVHEAAHAAFSKAANRVPILNDILRILGVDATVSNRIARSSDATELVAYMTQKKYISEMNSKDWEAAREHFLRDSVVQGHLDNILKKIKQPPVSFKERFIDAIHDAVVFVKAKMISRRSLRDVRTFADFYSGLISGEFADEMRLNQEGSPWRRVGTAFEDGKKFAVGDVDFDWSRVLPDAERMALDLVRIQEEIEANKQAQLKAMDDIKTEAQRLMEKAQALNKGVPAKLDVQSYVDVQLTNDLKKAFKTNNSAGAVQAVLNKAIEEANPYVSRSSVIAARAAEEAYKFRKKVYRDMKVKENIYGKKKGDKFNDLVDKVTEDIITKTTGGKKNLTAIDDAELTRILNNNDDPHTIRYMLNGVEQRMVLSGKGSEALVQEFYAPEATVKSGIRKILGLGNSVAQAKRYLTTSADPTRVLPNLMRDWSRGIVTTGGEVLLSPDKLRTDAIENGNYTPEQVRKINNGFELAKQAVDESTFTASMQRPRKNRKKSMIRAMNEPQDGNAFTRFIYDRTESAGKLFSTLQDTAETFTRKRAMENAYYRELANATARGMKIDDAVKRATEAAYFYGREATVNFFRRGKLVAEVAQMVPYLSQNFASLESFKYAYLDNPIAVTRSLRATVSTYATLIAIALSNDESRKRYFMLSEYDRAHNIIVPLTNDLIVTIPMDETVAAFLTPYRRMVESLNGVDPEAFYLWAAEGLEALSPLDLSGFSEGDKLNVVRGFQKIGSQVIPTWAQPILESMTGTDWYYGSNLRVDEDYVGSRTGNWTPTPGELTTRSKNSEVLSHVANATGIPQWIVQNIYSEYGGNVGQYFLNMLDKMSGATEEAQGGKEFFDSIFKPMTGADSDEASNAFWAGVNQLDAEKRTLQREIMTLNDKIKAATGEDKAELQQQRQDKINKYGTRISDFLNQYLSAFEITGGLTKSQANRIWRLYDIYDLNQNEQLYRVGSPEEYHNNKASKAANKEATNLAALSGLDKYYHTPIDDYHQTYAQQMFRNTIYGEGTQRMVDIANILEDTSDYNNSFTKLRSDMYEARKKAFDAQDWDTYDKLAYQYDFKILSAVYPYLLEHGVAETLNKSEVMEYLKEWIVVPSEEMKTAKGRYVPNLGVDSEKSKAFKKQFIKKMYGVSGE